ncbi:hypothetical protein PITCH_A920002 [uncultured Desulfobacterium sp.]|uniref:Uncharacterized protein n=1 Tax=uncultured Desulfobacterium sp. TaxID=201089 RepID=A0A445N3V6_9BACT|nr:hypothetical protein PITCH_A920002 [uncultured Desulfobacterium sp.]
MVADFFWRRILAQYEHLPIYKAAFDLLLYLEKIVANFSRYNGEVSGARYAARLKP